MSDVAALLTADVAARTRALELHSFIVEAPAGAGKTELLTQRYLRLLATVEDPEEVVAITFTNKAAAEMRSRILDNLERALRAEPPAESHKRTTHALARDALETSAARGWQLLEQPGRLRITTIDAFCAGIARQMPILSRFGSQPRIADDPRRHYREAARRVVARLEEDGGEKIGEALRHFENDGPRLCKLLARMLERRDQWLRHALTRSVCANAEEGLKILVIRDLERAAAYLDDPLQERLMPAARYAAANLSVDDAASSPAVLAQWDVPLRAQIGSLDAWRALCDLLLTHADCLRKRLTVAEGFPSGKESVPHKRALMDCLAQLAHTPGAEAAIARIRKLPDPCYSVDEWATVEVLSELLKQAAVELWQVFNEEGEADFVEVASRALLALGTDEPTELALRLDYRIAHLLIDEFQDTSPTQIELLRRLTGGWQQDDGRTLFVVGDPMQSIYRFRKADVGLFLRAAETGVANLQLERLSLYRNNRAYPPLVDWVNRSFDRVFPAADDVIEGAIRYRPFVATREQQADAAVHVHALVVSHQAHDATDGIEAAEILDIVGSERAADPGRKIAILVRARKHLEALIAEIRSRQPRLHFSAIEIEGLAARQPVQDLLALTRALHHRADRVNWLALLRAPWCGLTLADLHALAADDHAATVWHLINDSNRVVKLSPDGQRRLAHVRAIVAEAFAHQGRMRLRRLVEGTWLKLGGAACLEAPAELADAKAYLDLLDRLDASGRFSLDRLSDEVAGLYAAPDAAADGSLQLMTIHKAKGLEFDTVIVPGLHRLVRNSDQELMLWEEVALEGLDEQLVAAPIRRRGDRGARKGIATPYDYLCQLEARRSGNENARLLYVAATRAVRSLHLVGVAKENPEGGATRVTGSFLDLIWPVVGTDFAAASEVTTRVDATEGSRFVPRLTRIVSPESPAALQREASKLPQRRALDGGGADGTLHPLEASIGILVHRYLDLMARSGIDAWSPARIRSLATAMTLWFGRRGHEANEAKEGAARVASCLDTTLASRDGRWILASHQGAAAELAVNMREPEGTARHIVDRTFIEDGMRWIIDYKTTPLEGGDAAFVHHAERHRAQLERYARLFAEEALPCRLAVFYVASGTLIELQTDL